MADKMDNQTCNDCMLGDLNALVEKLASSKTDAESEEISKLASDMIGACRCPDNDEKNAHYAKLKERMDRLVPKRNK